jgi:CBS domain-containing protein
MRTVRDVMSGDIEVLRATESAADAASFLAAHDLESIPLCQSDGSLAGIVSARDILAKVVAKGLDAREVPLSELAEPGDVLSLDIDVPVEEAVTMMCRHHRARLPVVEGDRVVGLVTQRDVARCIAFRPSWVDGLDDLTI